MRLACLVVLACSFAACGSDNNNTGGDGPTNDLSAAVNDLATAARDLAGASDLAGAADGSTAMTTLKVENYIEWCTVMVNGAPATMANSTGTQTFTFPSGMVVNLNADKKNNGFVWAYWVGTAGDVGAAHDTAMSTTVTMTSDKTVQACCPVAGPNPAPCPPPT